MLLERLFVCRGQGKAFQFCFKARAHGAQKVAPTLRSERIQHDQVWVFQSRVVGDVESQTKGALAGKVNRPQCHTPLLSFKNNFGVQWQTFVRPGSEAVLLELGPPTIALLLPGFPGGGHYRFRSLGSFQFDVFRDQRIALGRLGRWWFRTGYCRQATE